MNDDLDLQTMYEICLDLAKQSPCQKRGFGCVLMLGGSIVAETNNHPIDDLSHLCEPFCIRLDIPSGVNVMVSDCGHAEEHAIWECIRRYGSAEGAELWIVGVTKSDMQPIENLAFYCVRCATLMRYARVAGVHIHSGGGWKFVTTAEAYKTSLEYALGRAVA